jgi:hypothetical protein
MGCRAECGCPPTGKAEVVYAGCPPAGNVHQADKQQAGGI